VQLGLSLSQALAELHRHGLVHRDVKPSNIIFVKGHAKLADIGLVAHAGDKKRLGTEGYIPPEGPGKPQADLYSLGMVLYEASTGTDRLNYPDLPRDFEAMAERETFLKLNSIILKACENDVRKRYHTAIEISDDLTKLGVGTPIQKARSHFRRPVTVLSAALLSALAFAVVFYLLRSPRTIPAPEKSIAILPFENLSTSPDDAYFAEGIQEEILTRLAKIPDLRVISRTSTRRYGSKPGNLSEIARQLRVANIVEGSVQKVANQVRVNAQLINPRTDSHLWAESYDRELTDVFGVESEIAKGIAESLQAKLTTHEEQALAAKPTNNPEAYDAYLRGLAFEARSYFNYSSDLVRKAAGFYERAVQLDPNFALAWARLSRANANLYFGRGVETTSARRDAAKSALEHAQKLEPNSPETLLALGYYQYWVLRDYGSAKTTFGRVSNLLPGSSEVPYALALVTRREGHWDQSIAYFEQALAVDPRNVPLLMDAAETSAMFRQFPAALTLYDRVLDITPNDPDGMGAKASIYQAQGNLQEAAKLLVDVNARTPAQFLFETKIVQLRLERNLGEAVRLLQARLAQSHVASQDEKASEQVFFALTQRVAGDTAGAKITAEQARNTLEHLYRDQSDNLQALGPRARADLALQLSLACAVMGEKDPAIKTAEGAIMLLPRTNDAAAGPVYEENLALIETIVGENSPAISAFNQLLQTAYSSWYYGPAPITPALLRLDPIWDPLRSDPTFLKLIEDSASREAK
jgi:TolB-like protein/Tfp pilus assembly protein PilF